MSEFRGGLYRGVVVRNDDPDVRLRVQVRIHQIHGGQAGGGPTLVPDDLLPWAEPALPFGGLPDQGAVMLPAVGSTVWIGFELGSIERPVYIGAWYGRGEKPAEIADPEKDRIIKTPTGHLLHFRDDGSNGFIHLKHADGSREVILDGAANTLTVKNKTGQRVVLDENADKILVEQTAVGEVEITNGGGAQRILLDGPGEKILVEQSIQKIEIDGALEKTTIQNGVTQMAVLDGVLQEISLQNAPTQLIKANLATGMIDLITGATIVNIALAGTVTVTAAGAVKVLAATVELGASASGQTLGIVLGDGFKALFDAHVHPEFGVPGVTGPPTVPATPPVYSLTVKAQP